MAINFPSAPNSGDSYTDGSQTWIYNGSAWDAFYQPTAKSQVGLGNVDNTSDVNKPVSTAQQAALDALTKDDVGLDNVDNTSDINKPVSTAQQAAIDAAGGSSFDQDLNTTDSPTFATLTTTTTVATDFYAVDVGATGTLTATNLNVTDAYTTNIGADYVDVDQDITTTNLDATGTVTAGDVTSSGTIYSNNIDRVDGNLVLRYNGSSAIAVRSADILVYKTFFPQSSSYDLGKTGQRWGVVYAEDVDATGTVTAGGFVGTPQTLTDAASITYDLANGHNAKVTLTDDRILLFPTNIAEGASGVLTVTQDGTGGRALTFGSGWFISAGAAADISALGAGEKAQVTWYAHSSSDVNATILPLQ